MVRTLDYALTNALTNTTRRPALRLTIEDHVIHYALYQSPATADAWNDACIASDNSIIRVQVTRSGTSFTANFQVQRITDPAQASQWSSWTTLPGSSGVMFQDGGCAISNSGGVLHAFAQQGSGGNALWNWTSLDNGVTWTGPGVVLTPPASALLKGIASSGNNDVFFLYDVVGGDAIGYSFYSAGWSALSSWSLAPLQYGAGLAVAKTGSTYTIIYSDSTLLASCVLTPTGNVWSAGAVVAPATMSAIGRISPRLSYADGLYTLTCIELDYGTYTGSVYSYPRLRQSADLIHWSNGLIAHDLTSSFGAVAFKLPAPNSGSSGPRYYLATLSSVYSAPVFQSASTNQFLDASASVLSYQRHEQANKPARLELVLDNAQGVYNALVTGGAPPYRPIGLNASLLLSEGYAVGTPPTTADVVKVGTYRIEQIHFLRSPQENRLKLVGVDVSRNLDLVARYQNTYSNQSLAYLVAEVCARAGLFSVQLPSTSQMSQTVPTFVLPAGKAYRHALDELCSVYGLSYFLDQNEVMQFRELSASDPSVWSYQPEIEQVSFGSNDQRPNHIIVIGKPPTGSGVPLGATTTAEAFDDAHVHLVGQERLTHYVDPKLPSSTQCAQKATFLLAQAMRMQVTHSVALPLNPALQLLDGITLTDSFAPTGSGQTALCRIIRVHVTHDVAQETNVMQLTLEGM